MDAGKLSGLESKSTISESKRSRARLEALGLSLACGIMDANYWEWYLKYIKKENIFCIDYHHIHFFLHHLCLFCIWFSKYNYFLQTIETLPPPQRLIKVQIIFSFQRLFTVKLWNWNDFTLSSILNRILHSYLVLG